MTLAPPSPPPLVVRVCVCIARVLSIETITPYPTWIRNESHWKRMKGKQMPVDESGAGQLSVYACVSSKPRPISQTGWNTTLNFECVRYREKPKKSSPPRRKKEEKLYWHFLFFFVKWKHWQRRFWSDYTVLFSRSFFFFFFQEDDDFQWQKKIFNWGKGVWGMDVCLALSSLSNLFSSFFPFNENLGGGKLIDYTVSQSSFYLSGFTYHNRNNETKNNPRLMFFFKSFPNPKANARK